MPIKGLHQFLDPEQQQAWLERGAELPEIAERTQHLEHRFKYAARFEKLLRRPQAEDVLDILRAYGASCIPIPRTTERTYWSVSCLPSTSDKPLVRVNASWMELFTLLPDGAPASPLVGEVGGEPAASAAEEIPLPAEQSARAVYSAPPPNPPSAGIPRVQEDPRSLEARSAHRGEGLSSNCGLRARIILHLSDFTLDGSPEPDQLDTDLLESCAARPEDVSYSIWRDSKPILIAKVRGAASIRAFLANPHGLRAIRHFNLTHMNRGRNAYQASHCYSVADVMVGD